MQRGILTADRVLLVCSENYVRKAESGTGGVGFERLIVTAEVVQSIDTKKFTPLVRLNSGANLTPRFLGPRLYIDFREDEAYERRREELLRELLGAPRSVKPPLGPNPFSGELPPSVDAPRVLTATGTTPTGAPYLSGPWYENERAVAEKGLAGVGLAGCMELRFGPHVELVKSQLDLLNAVRKSEVHTFGWPIAVTLENRDEFKPRPYGDGIRAEVALTKGTLSGHQSYDYWALRRSGDFYLLQSLFEDSRSENEIYFNTRIVRVTEALMFASGLYANLGVPPDAQLSIRVAHRGLKGRALTAVGNRHMFPRTSHESVAESEVVVVLGKMRDALVDDVRRLVEPMFMLFEFMEFTPAIYEDIVRRFEKGETS
jgi:hypothetical protein